LASFSIMYDLWDLESSINHTDIDEFCFMFLTVTVAICISAWLVLATITPSGLDSAELLSALTICGLLEQCVTQTPAVASFSPTMCNPSKHARSLNN